MPLISTLLCSFALLVVGTATAGAQTVALFAVDPEYGWPRNVNNPDNAGTNLGLIGGALLAAQNKRETELSIEFRDAIQLDDLDLLVDLVRVPEVYGSSEIVRLDTLNDDTIANVLLERGLEEALLVRHYVASGGSFVARLVVERVSQQPRGVRRLHVATTYYYAALPQTLRKTEQGWSSDALSELKERVGSSLVELGDMWARLAVDTGGGRSAQEAWESFDTLAKNRSGWVFECGINGVCKRQRLIRVTEERAWIGTTRGSVVGSMDRAIAGAGSLILTIW